MSQHVSVTPLTPAQRLAYADQCRVLADQLRATNPYNAKVLDRMAVDYSQPAS